MGKRVLIFLVFMLTVVVRMAAQMVTGNIVDKEFGEPMPGVRIHYVDDKSTMVVSDINGNFKIAARKGQLLFSIIGYDHYMAETDGRKQK